MNKDDSLQKLKQKNEIIENAKWNDPKALEIIFSNPKDDDFLRHIVVRARTDKGKVGERAREFVYKNQDIERCWNCIVGMASDGSEYAFEIVLKNVNRFGSLKCIAEWAAKDSRAREIVFEHFNDKNCRLSVFALALSDSIAESFVLKHAAGGEFWLYVLNSAKEGSPDAIEKVLRNSGRDGAFKCIDYVIKQGYFKDLLNKKNECAISFALRHPEYADSMEFIIDRARKGNKEADDIVLRNIHNAKYQGRIIAFSKAGYEWAQRKLPQLAELGNRYAIEKILANPGKDEHTISFVFKHPEYLESMKYIIKCARKGDKVADEIVLRNIRNAKYQGMIVDLSKFGDEWAKGKLPQLAELGNRYAIEDILAHPKRDGFWYYAAQEAKKENIKYLDMVFKHYAENKECEQCVLEMLDSGNGIASKKAIELAKNGSQIFLEAICRKFPNNPIFRQIVIDLANSDVEFAEKTVLEAVKKGAYIQGFDEPRYALKLAKKNNTEAKEIIFSNASRSNRWLRLCRELASTGDSDAIKCAAENGWRVELGSVVDLQDCKTGVKRKYCIDDKKRDDLPQDVSVISPQIELGRQLMGKKMGDVVNFHVYGRGWKGYKILKIS